MKVCTDACLFGAWVAKLLADKKIPGEHILDIGTGTGLLGLILAQNFPVKIDAVEIEENAFRQAEENFAQSPWADNIRVIHKNITEFQPAVKYGLIITNPPFFENDLKAKGKEKNLARHEASLNLEQIFYQASAWMLNGGYLALLLPAFRSGIANEIAVSNGLSLCYATTVRQSTRHDPFRVMLIFSNQPCHTFRNEIVIKDNGNYTAGFQEILAPYYLNL